MAYEPSLPPGDAEALAGYVFDELSKVSETLHGVEYIHLEELHNPPERPRTGQIVFADGTDWDPGSGRGYYGYDAATPAWVKLG